jgi:hypothetical protein
MGPGIWGEVEKSGLASSRNEKAGIADESMGASDPGIAGADGCADRALSCGLISGFSENGRTANR